MTGISWVDVFVIVSIVGGALAFLWKVVGVLLAKLRRLSHFLDDWLGEAERPGVPYRPGFSERVALIEAELRPNHGSSLRDAINRVEEGVRRVEDGLAAHLEQHRNVGQRVVNVTNVPQIGADAPDQAFHVDTVTPE